MSNDLDGWVKIDIPDLTIEQQFEIAKARKIIEMAEDAELRQMFIDMFTVMSRKDNLLRALLAEKFDLPLSKIINVAIDE